MSKASEFYQGLQDAIKNAVKSVAPFRAKVHQTTANGIQIQTYDATAPMAEPFARLDGPALKTNDDVAVINLGGRPFILGKITTDNTEAGPSGAFTAPVTIDANGNVLLIRDANRNPSMVFNAESRYFFMQRDSHISGHRLSDGAQTYWIRSSDGSAKFTGDVNANTINGVNTGTLVNQFHSTHHTQATATTQSTTGTGVWNTHGGWQTTLPEGTWTVDVVAMGRLSHSAAGSVSFRAVVNGASGTAVSGQAAGTTNSFSATARNTGQSGTILIQCHFMNNAAGTAYAGACSLFVVAKRTA